MQIFSGNTNAFLSNLPCNRNELFDLHVELAKELKDKTVLYTQDIEEKYKKQPQTESPNKRRKVVSPSPSDYLKVLIVDSRFCDMIESPLSRMTIYFAADIPWALDTSMSINVFKSFVNELMLRSEKALAVAGDPMGIVAAQSCSERFTQTTLNSFHLAGMKKSAVTGIERINQLLNGTKSLEYPLLGPIVSSGNPETLVEKSLGDYCYESGVVFKVRDDDDFSNFSIILRFNKISDWWGVVKGKLTSSFRRDSEVEGDTVYIKFTNKNSLDDIKVAFAKLIKTHVSGIKYCIEYDKDDKMLIFAPKTPLVKTRLLDKTIHSIIDNSTLLEHCPDMDLTKMYSNDIYYIQATLGIAAAESFIFEELKRTLGNEGININPAHVNLMAANMTSTGSIMPNTSSGVNLEDSVILKATFQESTKMFANAAFNNFRDNINDVSSQIMVGIQPRIGTQRVGCYYKEVGDIVERVCDSPEYAPMSPEYAELPDDYDNGEYVPSSPVYAPASPVYYVNGELAEPEINI